MPDDKRTKNRALWWALGFIVALYLAHAVFFALDRVDRHTWVTSGWQIHSHQQPFLYALLPMFTYFIGPLVGLFLAYLLLVFLAKRKLLFVAVGGLFVAAGLGFLYVALLTDPPPGEATGHIVTFLAMAALMLGMAWLLIHGGAVIRRGPAKKDKP